MSTEGLRAPRVSIITPTFNAERYVDKCLNSVLNQSYNDWELLLVDDGSTDATIEVAAAFDDPRIRIIALPHRGIRKLAETYNVALQSTRGDLIAILEGDDCWPYDKLELQVIAFADPLVQISWGKAVVIDASDQACFRWPGSWRRKRTIPLHAVFRSLTRANILTPAVTVMVRRSALAAAGGFQEAAGAPFVDWPTWLMVAARCHGTASFVPRCLGYYRMHTAQTSHRLAHEMETEQLSVVQAVLRGLEPETLDRLGWSSEQNGAAVAGAHLPRGIALMRAGQEGEARRDFSVARYSAGSRRERLKAVLGLLSLRLRYDLVAAIQGMRRRVGRLILSDQERKVE